jgi:hypothetical protein
VGRCDAHKRAPWSGAGGTSRLSSAARGYDSEYRRNRPVGERRFSVEEGLVDGGVGIRVAVVASILLVLEHGEGLINAKEDLLPLRLHRLEDSGAVLAAFQAPVGAVYPTFKSADVRAGSRTEGLKLRPACEGEERAASEARGGGGRLERGRT